MQRPITPKTSTCITPPPTPPRRVPSARERVSLSSLGQRSEREWRIRLVQLEPMASRFFPLGFHHVPVRNDDPIHPSLPTADAYNGVGDGIRPALTRQKLKKNLSSANILIYFQSPISIAHVLDNALVTA